MGKPNKQLAQSRRQRELLIKYEVFSKGNISFQTLNFNNVVLMYLYFCIPNTSYIVFEIRGRFLINKILRLQGSFLIQVTSKTLKGPHAVCSLIHMVLLNIHCLVKCFILLSLIKDRLQNYTSLGYYLNPSLPKDSINIYGSNECIQMVFNGKIRKKGP